MSEPVSNAEIEDVLSSIRRLVSENAGAVRRGESGRETPEKLVLTPAFRVNEGEADAEPDAPLAQDGEVVSLDGAGWTDGGPEAVEEAVAAAVEDWGGVSVEDEVSEAIDEAPAPEQADADPATQETAEDPYKSELERRIAELEAVIARSAAEFEPDGSEDDSPAPVMFRHDPDAGEGQAEPTEASPAEPDAVLAEAEAASEAAPDADTTEDADEDMSRTQAGFEQDMPLETEDRAAVGAPEAEFDAGAHVDPTPVPEEVAVMPHVSYADDHGHAADAWEDVEAEDVAGDDDEAEETVLDEAALRELVARMVREELQGSVGERITHNVRRMVRREIARALALQDFE